MLKLLLITVILMGIAFTGLAIRILLERNGQFSGGSCQSRSDGLDEKGLSCGCGRGECVSDRAQNIP